MPENIPFWGDTAPLESNLESNKLYFIQILSVI